MNVQKYAGNAITTLVLIDLAIDTGQLTAKQSRKSTSQILKLPILI